LLAKSFWVYVSLLDAASLVIVATLELGLMEALECGQIIMMMKSIT